VAARFLDPGSLAIGDVLLVSQVQIIRLWCGACASPDYNCGGRHLDQWRLQSLEVERYTGERRALLHC
jgi:hypothetical protein